MDSVKRLYGVYRGVVRNNNDPQNQRRLKLQVQTTGAEVTDWAWPVDPSSIHTEVPVVGQGVWVSYVGGDPEYPVWHGSFGKNQGNNKHLFVKPLADSVSLTSVQDVIIINSQTDGTEELDLTDSLLAIANKEKSLQTTLNNLQGTVASIVQGTGIQGTQGTAGATGTQGAQGSLGSQGTVGVGIQGTQGSTGVQGTTGSQGTTGVGTQGTQGTQGANGAQGVQGLQGVVGFTGVQGTQGYTGVQGVEGSQGLVGAQGLQGTQGTQGTLGIQGATGAGLQGVQGTTGTQGIVSSSSAPTTQDVLWLDTTVAAGTGSLGDSGWVLVSSFANGFLAVSGVAYRKLNNVVYLRGNLTGGTANTGAFTLPSEYCPAATVVVPVQQYGTSAINYVTVGTDGVVVLNGTSGWLTSVIFPVG